jgi:thioredoxin-like negative regulator of GroEL
MILFIDGQEVDRTIGGQSSEDLMAWVDARLPKQAPESAPAESNPAVTDPAAADTDVSEAAPAEVAPEGIGAESAATTAE